jgi:hypothetical protein
LTIGISSLSSNFDATPGRMHHHFGPLISSFLRLFSLYSTRKTDWLVTPCTSSTYHFLIYAMGYKVLHLFLFPATTPKRFFDLKAFVIGHADTEFQGCQDNWFQR